MVRNCDMSIFCRIVDVEVIGMIRTLFVLGKYSRTGRFRLRGRLEDNSLGLWIKRFLVAGLKAEMSDDRLGLLNGSLVVRISASP